MSVNRLWTQREKPERRCHIVLLIEHHVGKHRGTASDRFVVIRRESQADRRHRYCGPQHPPSEVPPEVAAEQQQCPHNKYRSFKRACVEKQHRAQRKYESLNRYRVSPRVTDRDQNEGPARRRGGSSPIRIGPIHRWQRTCRDHHRDHASENRFRPHLQCHRECEDHKRAFDDHAVIWRAEESLAQSQKQRLPRWILRCIDGFNKDVGRSKESSQRMRGTRKAPMRKSVGAQKITGFVVRPRFRERAGQKEAANDPGRCKQNCKAQDLAQGTQVTCQPQPRKYIADTFHGHRISCLR